MNIQQLVQIIVLALLQGVTELFPISSLGHTVILPGVLGWTKTLNDPNFVPVLVTLHLGTATALIIYFWRDWVNLLRGGLRVVIAGKLTPDVDPGGFGRQLVLVVIGTIPAGIVGVVFQKALESNFSVPILAAAFLVMNGAVLLAGELLWRNQRQRAVALLGAKGYAGIAPSAEVVAAGVGKSLDDMTYMQAALIGCAQIFALIPGFSRSGLTMVAGMANGLSHEAAARFSFLMATPIILGAGVLEVPKLLAYKSEFAAAAIGGVVAGVAAYLSVRFLMRYFETNRLDPFAYYCIALGLIAFAYFALTTLGVIPAVPTVTL
ncbi:MAG TPA: undecaprenyl-diphosphate phosphatase [Ktedonobacterales bacterium]|nr:undecaprenyl-diphosphate phosphatase [Ktedonobacterales bacterium]